MRTACHHQPYLFISHIQSSSLKFLIALVTHILYCFLNHLWQNNENVDEHSDVRQDGENNFLW